MFDILLTSPIQSQFGLATEQETQWALEQFSKHVFGEFSAYENFEIYRDPQGVCDILSLQKDPLAFYFASVLVSEIPFISTARGTFSGLYDYIFINIFLFLITYLILSRFIYNSQDNVLRSFTLYAGKSQYMTIAATNEKDVSVIIKRLTEKIKLDLKLIQLNQESGCSAQSDCK